MKKKMNSISCRSRDCELRVNPIPHFPNFRSEKVDGKVKLVESEPVVRAMADDFSVIMNAMRNEKTALRSRRVNIDAVDLEKELNNF